MTGSGSWSCDGCLLGSVPPQLRVCVFHTAQTFLLSQPQSGPSLAFTGRRSGPLIRIGAVRNFSEGSSGIPAAAAGTAFLSFRIHAAFRCLRRDCLKVQKPAPPGQRRGVGKRRRSHEEGCLIQVHRSACKDPLRTLPGVRTEEGSAGTTSAMAGAGRKGSGRPSYYYRFLGKSRLQRQRSRSRSRTRPAANRGKASSCLSASARLTIIITHTAAALTSSAHLCAATLPDTLTSCRLTSGLCVLVHRR